MSGWRQAPVAPKPPPCPHVGLLFAAFSLRFHPVGHEWVCNCGAVFVVVSNGLDGPKSFEQRKRPSW